MITHLEALKADLESHGWDVFLLDATGAVSWPYVVLGPGYSSGPERPLADLTGAFDVDLRVRVAGETTGSVVGLAQAVRDVLSPSLGWRRVTVPGRFVEVRWVRTELVEVDRDVKVTGTNRHPIFEVDTYRMVSNPLPAIPEP